MLNVLSPTGASTAAPGGAALADADGLLPLAWGLLDFRRLLLMTSAVATSAAITSTTTTVTATRLAPPRGSRGGRAGGYGRPYGWRYGAAPPRPPSGSAQVAGSSGFGWNPLGPPYPGGISRLPIGTIGTGSG